MDIFQPKYERRPCIDDTEPIVATIESSHTVNGHTEYVLRCRRGHYPPTAADAAASWLVHRRYNDFVQLHRYLEPAGLSLPLPAKKLFGNLRPEFVAERLVGLQLYLDAVLMNPILMSGLMARRFVDPDQYGQSFADAAIQNAALCLRADGHYVLGASLGAIGWRVRKHYFRVTPRQGCGGQRASSDYVKTGGKHVLVKSGSQQQQKEQQQLQKEQKEHQQQQHKDQQHQHGTVVTAGAGGAAQHTNGSGGGGASSSSSQTAGEPTGDLCLTWTEFGPDKYVDERELQSVLKSLVAAHHPYVVRCEYATANDQGALVVRRFAAGGTVKDRLCGTQPRQLFLQKYGNPNGRQTLPLADVALWARQVLEALRWLHERGLPSGHVHAGNVVLEGGRARLLDVENWVLGVPAFYRPFFMQHSKIGTAEAVDVYSFGHLVFEMAMGYALQESVTSRQAMDAVPAVAASATLKSLLESILSRDACRIGLPTLDQLAGHPFFAEYAPQFDKLHAAAVAEQKPTLKLSTAAKEQLRLATQRTEQRLQNEQKSTKNQKRLVKIQEMMSCEEEKKKTTKHKTKLEQKQSKLRQQNSLQLSCGPSYSMASTVAQQGAMPPPPSPLNRADSALGGLLSPPSAKATVGASATSSSAGSSSSVNQTATPPPPPAPAPPKQQPSQPSATASVCSDTSPNERSALLGSISTFNKSTLRKIE